jgi:hypothetical protein
MKSRVKRTRYLPTLLIGLLLAVVWAGPAASDAEKAAEVEALTFSLVGLNNAYTRAKPGAQPRGLQALIDTAAERQALLAEIIADDPGTVLRNAIPTRVRAHMPTAVQALVEETLEVDGELRVLYADYEDGAELIHKLNINHRDIGLYFESDPPGLASGTKIRAAGVLLGDAMALESTESVLVLAAAGGSKGGSNGGEPAPAPSAVGEQRTLVMMVNFQDDVVEPYTADDAWNVVFDEASRFFLENSHGQTSLSGDVVGWYTIPMDSTVCDPGSVELYAQSEATDAGIDLSEYTRLLYVYPDNACGWWGLSTVGGDPSHSHVSGKLQLHVVAHELGHALGLFHSNALNCDETTLGPDCAIVEYGDVFDKMGSTTISGHYNAFQKERLGWLDDTAEEHTITTVGSSGRYALGPYEIHGDVLPNALKILKSIDPATGRRTWYYIEWRQAIGFDAFLATYDNALNGVMLHTGTEANGNSSYLLDINAIESGSAWDWYHTAPLVDGQAFSDPEAGVTIWVDSVTTDEAIVTVQLEENRMTVTSDKESYWNNETVTLTAQVGSVAASVANVTVEFTLTKADGSQVKGSASTQSDGTAVFKHRLKKRDPSGTYVGVAVASSSQTPLTAETVFTVR